MKYAIRNSCVKTAVASLLYAVTLLGAALPAAAQDYPARPIRFIVTAQTGSTTDLVFRVVAGKMSERRGWTTLIENRVGGDHIIGMQHVAQSPPDGYTVLGMVSSATLLPVVKKGLPFDLMRDFAPVTRIATVDTVMVVRSELPITNLQELVAYTKANPGKVDWSAGVHAATLHIVGEQIKLITGFDGTHIPYKTSLPLVNDMLAGTIAIGLTSIGNVRPHINAGKLRPILVLHPRRSPALPDVPSTADAGMPQVDAGSWFGYAVHARTPKDIIGRLHAEILAIGQLPETREQFAKLGSNVLTDAPEELRKQLEREVATWTKVVKDANIRVD